MLLCCCAYRALIITTGLDAAAFETLLESFKPVWLSHTPRSDNFNRVTGVTLLKSRRGRPRVLDAAGGLAIVLHWLRSKCSFCDLCFVFGTVPSCTNIWVQLLLWGQRLMNLKSAIELRLRFMLVVVNAKGADLVCIHHVIIMD